MSRLYTCGASLNFFIGSNNRSTELFLNLFELCNDLFNARPLCRLIFPASQHEFPQMTILLRQRLEFLTGKARFFSVVNHRAYLRSPLNLREWVSTSD